MKTFFYFLLLIPIQLFSQVMPLQDTDIPQALISSTAVLTGQDFRDHMKGSGEMYLEYGFRSLLVQDIRWNSEHIILEAFEMTDPTSAYGVYSVNVPFGNTRDSLTSFDCFSPGMYQAAYGRFYLRIKSETPTNADKSMFSLIARKFMGNNPDSLFKMPGIFLQNPIRRFGKDPWCTKGVIGVQHTPVSWQDLFSMVRNIMFVVILPFDRDVIFARISFTSVSDKMTFLKRAGMLDGFTPLASVTTSDGMYREYRQIDETNIYFLESQLPFGISSIVP